VAAETHTHRQEESASHDKVPRELDPPLGLGHEVVQRGKQSKKKNLFICWEKNCGGKRQSIDKLHKRKKTGKEKARWEGLKHHTPNI